MDELSETRMGSVPEVSYGLHRSSGDSSNPATISVKAEKIF